jgi:hypothetical protein
MLKNMVGLENMVGMGWGESLANMTPLIGCELLWPILVGYKSLIASKRNSEMVRLL